MPHHVPYRQPHKIQVARIRSSSYDVRGVDNFALYLQYYDDTSPQRYASVHIPKPLQDAFLNGEVKGLHLELLPSKNGFNTEISQSISGGPDWVVLGIELPNGERIQCIPEGLRKLFKRSLCTAAVALIAGVALWWTAYAWVGGLLFAYGVSRAKFARTVPLKAVWPTS